MPLDVCDVQDGVYGSGALGRGEDSISPHLLTSFESLVFLLVLLDAPVPLFDFKGEVLDYIEEGAQRASVSGPESEVKGFLATETG